MKQFVRPFAMPIAALCAALTCVAQAEVSRMIEKSRAEHYAWGDGNDGWHLVKQAGMSVIQERMRPGGAEARHYHGKARQFFYVMSGELTMEAAGETTVLKPGQGIEIAPGTAHQAQNRSTEFVEFLVNSTPPSHGDRVAAPLPDASAE